jgi:hypothetical protein
MNPKQLMAWAERKRLQVTERRGTYTVSRGGEDVAVLQLGADNLFLPEHVGALFDRTGREMDMPGIGRIPIPAQRIHQLFRDMGFKLDGVGGNPNARTIVVNNDAFATVDGPLPTEVVRDMVVRVIALTVGTTYSTNQPEAEQRFRESLYRATRETPELVIGTLSYLDPAEMVAEAFAISARRATNTSAEVRDGRLTQLDQFVFGAEMNNEAILVTRTEYNQNHRGLTQDLARLRQVYDVFVNDPNVRAPRMTVRLYERVRDGMVHVPEITFPGIRDVGMTLQLSDKATGLRKNQEFTQETVPLPARAGYQNYLEGRGEAAVWKDRKPDDNEGK